MHTNGPWRIEEYSCHFEIWPDRPGEGISKICQTHRHATPTWKEDDRDNARLIAAAPSLLEACKTAVHNITSLTSAYPDRFPIHAFEGTRQLLISVIATAEGH